MRPFERGMLAGFLLALATVAVLGWVVLTRGVSVQLDDQALAATVQRTVRRQAQAQLPKLLADWRGRLPAQVAASLGPTLQGMYIDFAGQRISLPPQVAARIRSQIAAQLQKSLDRDLAGTDTARLADQLSTQVAAQLSSALRGHLAGHPLVFRPYPWLAVPVTVRPG